MFKSFKTISFFDAFFIGFLLWVVLFASIFAIYEVLNIFFSDIEVFKSLNHLLKNLDTFIGNIENFFIEIGFPATIAEKMAAVPIMFILFFPALVISLFFLIYKEIIIGVDKNIIIKRRFNSIDVEILIKKVNLVEINKSFRIMGKANMQGGLFKEVEYRGSIYPIKIETSAGAYRLFIKGEILAELKKELSEVKFIEKDLNKNIVGVIFLVVVSVILLVFFKIFSKLGM